MQAKQNAHQSMARRFLGLPVVSAFPPHPARLIPKPPTVPSFANDVARTVMLEGQMPELSQLESLMALSEKGEARLYLLFSTNTGEAGLVIETETGFSDPRAARATILQQYGHWLNARRQGSVVLDQHRMLLASYCAHAADRMLILAEGLLTPSRWERSHPASMHFIQSFGVNCELQLHSVRTSHCTDNERLGLVAAIDREGRNTAARWQAANAVAAIDANAMTIARACGLAIPEILRCLEVEPVVDFEALDWSFSGHFRWMAGEIVPFLTYWDQDAMNEKWELDGRTLTVLSQAMPDTLVDAIIGRHLNKVAEGHPMFDPDGIIERARNATGRVRNTEPRTGDLVLEFGRRTRLLSADYKPIPMP